MPTSPDAPIPPPRLRWWHFAVLAIAPLALGYLGFRQYLGAPQDIGGFLDILYRSLQLFVMEFETQDGEPMPALLHAARFTAPLVPAAAVIWALLAAFGDRMRLWRLRTARDHIVICGLGRKGTQLVRDCRRRGNQVVAVELEPGSEYARACRDLGATVLAGNAADQALLRRAGVQRARRVVAFSGDDGINVDILLKTHELLQELPLRGRRDCTGYVHVVDLNLCELFRSHAVFADRADGFEVRIINIHEMSVRLLFEDHPLDHGLITADDPRQVRLICVGLGKTGEAVVMQAVRTGHFANGRRLQLTVVDWAANAKNATFCGRHPGIRDVCDLEFLEGDIADEAMLRQLRDRTADPQTLTTVVVSMNDDSLNLRTALNLHARLGRRDIPICVRMIETDGLTTLLPEGGRGSLPIHPFGMGSRVCTLRMLDDPEYSKLVTKLHEAVLSRWTPLGEPEDRVLWRALPERRREAFQLQADHLPVMLSGVGMELAPDGADDDVAFAADDLETLARMEYARRRAERRLAGKDMVNWDQADNDTKQLYRDHIAALPGIVAGVGLGIRRRAAGD